jgi:hypothetical protein
MWANDASGVASVGRFQSNNGWKTPLRDIENAANYAARQFGE